MTTRSASLPIRAKAQLELRRRKRDSGARKGLPELYAFDPAGYIRDMLDWEPWQGTSDAPGQVEVIEAYTRALRQQHERLAWEAGEISTDQLQHWTPGEVIQYLIRIEAGHTVGKTKLAAGLVNHFFDCCIPSLIYTFAPSWLQIHDLLWKEIKSDRRGAGLPGRILDLELHRADNHFAKGRATNNDGGKGTERVQGQHGKYLMFVLDEAEGVADFVFDAIKSMTSGGIVIVLMLANPRTRTSRFHKVKSLPAAATFRISCIHHPNVLVGREIIPGAVRREYVEEMVDEHCEVVEEIEEDDHTFTLQFPVRTRDTVHPPGTIFKPDPEFMFRVLGVAPASVADNTFVPVGRYEAAKKRTPTPDRPEMARLGLDVARYGKDFGTLYVRWNGRLYRAAHFAQQDTGAYYRKVKEVALDLARRGVLSLHLRIDAGGGFGGGVADRCKEDLELSRAFGDFRVIEVHFNGTPQDPRAYADRATELYAHAAETLKGVALVRPPDLLEGDLCERTYKWVNFQGQDVKELESKEQFRKRLQREGQPPRSPDDGDGCVLAAAPDFVFGRPGEWRTAPRGEDEPPQKRRTW